jgi:hypothetical protein
MIPSPLLNTDRRGDRWPVDDGESRAPSAGAARAGLPPRPRRTASSDDGTFVHATCTPSHTWPRLACRPGQRASGKNPAVQLRNRFKGPDESSSAGDSALTEVAAPQPPPTPSLDSSASHLRLFVTRVGVTHRGRVCGGQLLVRAAPRAFLPTRRLLLLTSGGQVARGISSCLNTETGVVRPPTTRPSA